MDFQGRHEGYNGKPRETWHPYDRKSGTGRGREVVKQGHGKANWGDLKDELALGERSLPASTSGAPQIVQVPAEEKISEIPELAA